MLTRSSSTMLRRLAARSFSSKSALQTPPASLCWTDVWSFTDQERLRCSSDGTTVRRAGDTTAAALGGLVLSDLDTWSVSVAARGSSIMIGLAEGSDDADSNPWLGRAWGLALWSGRLFESDSMTELCKRAQLAHPRPNAPGGASHSLSETLVRMRFDGAAGSIRFSAREDAWVSGVDRVAPSLRPWVLFVGPGGNDDAVKLVAATKVLRQETTEPTEMGR